MHCAIVIGLVVVGTGRPGCACAPQKDSEVGERLPWPRKLVLQHCSQPRGEGINACLHRAQAKKAQLPQVVDHEDQRGYQVARNELLAGGECLFRGLMYCRAPVGSRQFVNFRN